MRRSFGEKNDKTVAGNCIEVALAEPEAVELVPQNIPWTSSLRTRT